MDKATEAMLARAEKNIGPCQCEHACHFPGSGLPGHAYGAIAQREAMKTTYGTFNVCQSCARECLAGFAK